MSNISISRTHSRTDTGFRTDWDRLGHERDEDINFDDIPEVTPEMFACAVARRGVQPPLKKRQVTLRIDEDVLESFQAQGRGYQTRINALLRAFVDAQRWHESRKVAPAWVDDAAHDGRA